MWIKRSVKGQIKASSQSKRSSTEKACKRNDKQTVDQGKQTDRECAQGIAAQVTKIGLGEDRQTKGIFRYTRSVASVGGQPVDHI